MSLFDYTGKCFRHRLMFIPSWQFEHSCPACYIESKQKAGYTFCPICYALLEPGNVNCDRCKAETTQNT